MKIKVHTKTLKVRIRDKHVSILKKWAYGVNQVWNFCNETSMNSLKNTSEFGAVKPVFLSGYDLQKHTKGMNKTFGLNSATVQMVGHEYVTRRKQFKKYKLNWRKTGGAKRSQFVRIALASRMGRFTIIAIILGFGIATVYLSTLSSQDHSMKTQGDAGTSMLLWKLKQSKAMAKQVLVLTWVVKKPDGRPPQ